MEVMDASGQVLANARLPEGVAGMARLHELIGQHLSEDAGGVEVLAGIETDRGPWVAALVAAGYTVYAVNPLQASRYRERHGVSGAKSDRGDAHMLADMVRTDSHQLRPVAGDSADAEGVEVLACTHKTLIWERTRHVQRLRHQLREYFSAALEAFDDLDAPDARAFYDDLRTHGIERNDALRRIANRLVGILHGCMKTRTLYDEATAWSHREQIKPAA